MNERTSRGPSKALLFLMAAFLLSPALLTSGRAQAQATSFRARLSPLPVDARLVNTVTGVGEVYATLSGSTLTVTGSFRGLSTPATAAHLHMSPPGRPGPVAQQLTVSNATAGDISGTLQLTAAQVTALRSSALYVQIHTEGNPAGEIRGWIYDVAEIGAEPANWEHTSLTVDDLVRDFVPVTDAMLRDPAPGDWPMIRRDYFAQSYSPLDQINAGNVRGLQLEWVWNMNDGSSEPAPIVYGGVIYLINPHATAT